MASPVDAGRNTTSGTVSTSSKVLDLPASIVAGDLLIVTLRSNLGGTTTWPAGWTKLLDDDTSDPSDDTTTVAYRRADGTEGATITVTGTGSKFCSLSWRITGAGTLEIGTIAQATSPDADPGAVTPTGGTKDYLFIAICMMDGESTVSAAPSGYSNFITSGSGSPDSLPTNSQCGGASKAATASSEDPGTFTHTNRNWTAYTLACHPLLSPPYSTVTVR